MVLIRTLLLSLDAYVGASLATFPGIFLWVWNMCGKTVESLLHIQVAFCLGITN